MSNDGILSKKELELRHFPPFNGCEGEEQEWYDTAYSLWETHVPTWPLAEIIGFKAAIPRMIRGAGSNHNLHHHRITYSAKARPTWAFLTCLKIMFGGWDKLKNRAIGNRFQEAFPDHDCSRFDYNQTTDDGKPAMPKAVIPALPKVAVRQPKPVKRRPLAEDSNKAFGGGTEQWKRQKTSKTTSDEQVVQEPQAQEQQSLDRDKPNNISNDGGLYGIDLLRKRFQYAPEETRASEPSEAQPSQSPVPPSPDSSLPSSQQRALDREKALNERIKELEAQVEANKDNKQFGNLEERLSTMLEAKLAERLRGMQSQQKNMVSVKETLSFHPAGSTAQPNLRSQTNQFPQVHLLKSPSAQFSKDTSSEAGRAPMSSQGEMTRPQHAQCSSGLPLKKEASNLIVEGKGQIEQSELSANATKTQQDGIGALFKCLQYIKGLNDALILTPNNMAVALARLQAEHLDELEEGLKALQPEAASGLDAKVGEDMK